MRPWRFGPSAHAEWPLAQATGFPGVRAPVARHGGAREAYVADEADWSGTNGEFAFLTSVFYTWNPSGYDPAEAAAPVERTLAAGP